MRTLAIALLALTTLPAAAQGRSHVDVIEVSGLVDPVQADFVSDAVAGAEQGGAEALVVHLDSDGGVIGGEELDVLARRVAGADVPVAIWVGPNGGRAVGAAFRLLEAADVRGVAPGTRVGRRLADALGPQQALAQRVVDVTAPTLGDFIVGLDGRQVGPRTLETAEVVNLPGQEQPKRQPTVVPRFAKPGLTARLLHAAASPSLAYVLLVAGLALVVLELYTAGVGVAAVTAAGSLVLAGYGVGVLPTRPSGLALILLAAFGYAVDVQAGAPRAWTVIATGALVAGSLRLYEGLSPSPVALVGVPVLMVVLMVGGLPALVRARFSTATIGRESMVGESGLALVPVDPEGTVEVRGARWPARANRATPIGAGDPVRVVGVDGPLLEVEPGWGGADEHRRA